MTVERAQKAHASSRNPPADVPPSLAQADPLGRIAELEKLETSKSATTA
jgi:hypothetical protein